jgi:hypothetical protein
MCILSVIQWIVSHTDLTVLIYMILVLFLLFLLLVYAIFRSVGICEIFKGGQVRVACCLRDVNIADHFVSFFSRKLAVRRDGN